MATGPFSARSRVAFCPRSSNERRGAAGPTERRLCPRPYRRQRRLDLLYDDAVAAGHRQSHEQSTDHEDGSWMISAKRPPLWLTEVLWEFLGIRSAVRRGSPRASATCVDDVYLIAYAPIGSYVPYHRCIYVERTEFVARPVQFCRSRDRTGPVTRRRAATAIASGTIVRSGMLIASPRRPGSDTIHRPVSETRQVQRHTRHLHHAPTLAFAKAFAAFLVPHGRAGGAAPGVWQWPT